MNKKKKLKWFVGGGITLVVLVFSIWWFNHSHPNSHPTDRYPAQVADILIHLAPIKQLEDEVFQSRFVKTNRDEAVEVDKITFDFKRIKEGKFIMGSPSNEHGRHSRNEGTIPYEEREETEISRAFEMMTTEVTQSQWVFFMGSNPSNFKRRRHCNDAEDPEDRHTKTADGVKLCPNNPVERVSWNNVQEFIEHLNNAEGGVGHEVCSQAPLTTSGCYRLPTEAEWEYAARAEMKTAYFYESNDSSILREYAWFRGGSSRKTHPVGLLEPNPNGLFDIYGNVREWVQDLYRVSLPHGEVDYVNNDSGSNRVARGGGWNDFAEHLRSAYRYDAPPDYEYAYYGLRLVRTL